MALAAVNLAASLAFVFTGLMLRHEPGQRGVAWALILGGILRSVDFVSWTWGPLPFYTLVFGAMDRVFGAWALLRYPKPSLPAYQRLYLGLLVGWMLVGRTLIAVTSRAAWVGATASSWWPALIPDVQLNDIINYAVNAGEGLFGVTFIVLLVMRLRQTKGLDRIVIPPIIAAGLAATVAAIASATAQIFSSNPNDAYLVESVVDLALPLAFLVAATQRGLLFRTIAGLTAQLSGGAEVSVVRNALRAALHDPTLDILDLSTSDAAPTSDGNGTAGGADEAGNGAGVPMPDGQPADRLVEFIRSEAGAPIAVVLADPGLARYRGLFDAAVQTSALALKNAELQARAARAELEHVRASRARIVEAGLAERRRLERDLHDGAQQHLLALAAQLSAAMTRTADPQAKAAFEHARDEMHEVLGKLRDLAHGIHPALLSHGGLAAALDNVAERLPLPVRVNASASRATPAVEATAYFVACEALTNVVKHAQASGATVLVRIDESALEMEIADDGIGGVSDGEGLANMRDRVSALDGELTVHSPPGQGTRLKVRIPCA
jgi:signal transduction histidine kinase